MSAGYLEVICGSMFSGKSEELIRRVTRVMIAKKSVAVFKPALDDRYGRTTVTSHDGRSLEAHVVEHVAPERILDIVRDKDPDVVAIDEAQFFARGVVPVVEKLVDMGERVIVAGLDMDFARRPFGPMPDLMAIADEVLKLKAICAKCGEPATFNQRLVNGRPASINDPLIVVGGKDRYEARCRACHRLAEDPGGGRD